MSKTIEAQSKVAESHPPGRELPTHLFVRF